MINNVYCMGHPGFEPGTNRLKAEYSTIELETHFILTNLILTYIPMDNKSLSSNWKPLDSILHKKFIQNFLRYRVGYHQLVALSGGQDSMCLTRLIKDYLSNNNIILYAIYIDHQWRKDSKKNIRHLINITKKMGINLTIYQIKQGYFTESQARKIRYKILLKHAIDKECSVIITGHHTNDQIETLLYNLFKGTNPAILSHFKNIKQLNPRITLLKPLANFSRSEINWLCRFFHLPIWSDTTNYNYNGQRNQLRYELVPYLKNYFNPQIENYINLFSIRLNSNSQYIEECIIKLYIRIQHPLLVAINYRFLYDQHLILQQKLIRLFLYYNYRYLSSKNIINSLLQNIIVCKKQHIYLSSIHILYIELRNHWLYTTIFKIK